MTYAVVTLPSVLGLSALAWDESWIYLSASPLLGISATLIAYRIAHKRYLATKGNPWMNPVVTSVVILIVFLLLTGISYEDYFRGGQFVHLLLGPATVALGVPLYRQCSKLRQLWLPMSVTLVAGVNCSDEFGCDCVGIRR